MQASAPCFQTAAEDSGADISDPGASDACSTGIFRTVDSRFHYEALDAIPSGRPFLSVVDTAAKAEIAVRMPAGRAASSGS